MELGDLLEGICFIGQCPNGRIISLAIPYLGGEDEKVAGARKPASQAHPLKVFCAPGKLSVKVNGQPLYPVFIINPLTKRAARRYLSSPCLKPGKRSIK